MCPCATNISNAIAKDYLILFFLYSGQIDFVHLQQISDIGYAQKWSSISCWPKRAPVGNLNVSKCSFILAMLNGNVSLK